MRKVSFDKIMIPLKKLKGKAHPDLKSGGTEKILWYGFKRHEGSYYLLLALLPYMHELAHSQFTT